MLGRAHGIGPTPMPSWVPQRHQKDQQDASHNKLPPYASCGSRLRHWLHSPQKVPTCGTGFKASTFIPSQQVAYNRGGIQATPDTSIDYLDLKGDHPYSSECVEGKFSEVELPLSRFLGSSA